MTTILDICPSLNRVQIVTAPGLPAELSGKQAYDLLSRRFLITCIQANRVALGIDDDVPEADLPKRLGDCLQANHPAAEAIAKKMGENLGFLLLVLKQGDPVNRAARTDWGAVCWEHWAQIQQVVLAGGLVAGELGQRMLTYTHALIGEAYTLEIAPHAAILPLLGAARYVPAGEKQALIFDFGQTTIKRALATYEDGALVSLKKLAPLPSLSLQGAEALMHYMAQVITQTWEETTDAPDKSLHLIASIASYLKDGRVADMGYYGQLHGLDLTHILTEGLNQQTQRQHTLRFIHDGTAAATVYAGLPKSAVITMGTALGIGYPPPEEGLRGVALREI